MTERKSEERLLYNVTRAIQHRIPWIIGIKSQFTLAAGESCLLPWQEDIGQGGDFCLSLSLFLSLPLSALSLISRQMEELSISLSLSLSLFLARVSHSFH